ncbi:hypothetical protein DCCM_3054 [Desulfocucumis palustris]|uniref:Uncharacterized protein n=1 Tax=Desulfocucumis palustris TaxID=1898651 RepID=A0A2L2XE04_9FIRM|nr:hypothetical protein DCCM_3054 [Desulfocucumis palustris]
MTELWFCTIKFAPPLTDNEVDYVLYEMIVILCRQPPELGPGM